MRYAKKVLDAFDSLRSGFDENGIPVNVLDYGQSMELELLISTKEAEMILTSASKKVAKQYGISILFPEFGNGLYTRCILAVDTERLNRGLRESDNYLFEILKAQRESSPQIQGYSRGN